MSAIFTKNQINGAVELKGKVLLANQIHTNPSISKSSRGYGNIQWIITSTKMNNAFSPMASDESGLIFLQNARV